MKPAFLCTSSNTSSSLSRPQAIYFQTTHYFTFKRFESTNSSQNNPQGFCDEFKSIKNPSTEQIAELVKKYNIVITGPITASSQTILSSEEQKQQYDKPLVKSLVKPLVEP